MDAEQQIVFQRCTYLLLHPTLVCFIVFKGKYSNFSKKIIGKRTQ